MEPMEEVTLKVLCASELKRLVRVDGEKPEVDSIARVSTLEGIICYSER